jgi:hypothetical protein
VALFIVKILFNTQTINSVNLQLSIFLCKLNLKIKSYIIMDDIISYVQNIIVNFVYMLYTLPFLNCHCRLLFCIMFDY